MYEDIGYGHWTLEELEAKVEECENGEWDGDADDYLMLLRALIDAKKTIKAEA